jgi:iron complex transport system ATP-binding protein
MKKKSILSLNNLEVGFNHALIDEINIEVDQPKLIYLMGMNGAGKSCLLKTIAKLNDAKSGTIYINGIDINKIELKHLARKISILLTEKISLEHILVEELIALGRSPYTNWNDELSSDDKKLVSSIIDDLNLKNLIGKSFQHLSDGQKQKVLLGRALAQTPEILLLDEPVSYLDIPSKLEFLSYLKDLVKKRHLVIIMSTHDVTNIKKYADEVWIVNNGKLNVYSPDDQSLSGPFKMLFGLDLN